jgi:hypothetical protein
MSKIGVERQARRLARLPNPQQRLEAGERLVALLEAAIERMRAIERKQTERR